MLTASGLLCLYSGSASIEGPGLCGRVLLWYLRRPRQLLLDVTVSPLEHFLVASPDVLPLRHDFCRPDPQQWWSMPCDVTLFSFLLNFRARKESWDMWALEGASSKKKEKKEHLEEPLNWDNLCAALWRSWPSNAPLKDADLNWDTADISAARFIDIVGTVRIQFKWEFTFGWNPKRTSSPLILCCHVSDSLVSVYQSVIIGHWGWNSVSGLFSRDAASLSNMPLQSKWRRCDLT